MNLEYYSSAALVTSVVVYLLAMTAYAAEWAAARKAPVEESVGERELVGVGARNAARSEGPPSPAAPASDASVEQRMAEMKVELWGRIGVALTAVGFLCSVVGTVLRALAAGRPPWGNMYEFTITGSFVVVLGYLLLRKRYGLSWMGPIVTAIELVLLMVAVLWLYDPIAPLSDALLSYWLVIHVMSAIIATGAFTLGGITSALYLVKSRSLARGGADHGYVARLPPLATLDRVSYRIHAFGFPVWTFAVLISGPIWAHQAWSSYWNWDPKEVCAFITWVLYAAYLHARSTAGWKGRNAAVLALVGVASLWFNFIGINYFSTTSQHSYANGARPFDLHHH
jgi:cytochrome c-type biogenesis protein CcsB